MARGLGAILDGFALSFASLPVLDVRRIVNNCFNDVILLGEHILLSVRPDDCLAKLGVIKILLAEHVFPRINWINLQRCKNGIGCECFRKVLILDVLCLQSNLIAVITHASALPAVARCVIETISALLRVTRRSGRTDGALEALIAIFAFLALRACGAVATLATSLALFAVCTMCTSVTFGPLITLRTICSRLTRITIVAEGATVAIVSNFTLITRWTINCIVTGRAGRTSGTRRTRKSDQAWDARNTDRARGASFTLIAREAAGADGACVSISSVTSIISSATRIAIPARLTGRSMWAIRAGITIVTIFTIPATVTDGSFYSVRARTLFTDWACRTIRTVHTDGADVTIRSLWTRLAFFARLSIRSFSTVASWWAFRAFGTWDSLRACKTFWARESI